MDVWCAAVYDLFSLTPNSESQMLNLKCLKFIRPSRVIVVVTDSLSAGDWLKAKD